MAAPLTGEPCMIGGISEEWPTEGSCYCFNPANGALFVSSEEWLIRRRVIIKKLISVIPAII